VETSKTILEHIDEIRSRLIYCFISFSLAFIISWFLIEDILRILIFPANDLSFIYVDIMEMFGVYMQVCFVSALILSSPVLLYQTIGFTDLTGGTTWTLSDTATAGANTYGLKVGISSYSIIVKKTAAYNSLVSNLAAAASQSFGIQFLAPTSFSDGVMKTGTLNLIITAH